jgi:hypothetical protein
MRRAVLFLSRFAISLWILLVVTFLSMLMLNAPTVPNFTPFAGISIKTPNNSIIHLPNRTFTCTETEQQFQCQAKIQNRLLDLSLTKGGDDDKYNLSNCRAWYGKQSASCRETGQNFAPIFSTMYEITGLGLSPQQLQAVKQKYWGINALMQMGELRLMWISMGLSLATGLSAAFLVWFYPGKFSKAFTSLACGFGIYRLVWGFLGRVQYDIVTPYGFTPDTWNWVVNGGAIVAGVGTIIATALLLWQRFNRLTKILVSISSTVGIFNLCWLSFSLMYFAYLPSFFQDEYVLMWLSAAISAIFAIAAALWLWSNTNQSIKNFLCLGSGFGAVAIVASFFLSVLLDLGYID